MTRLTLTRSQLLFLVPFGALTISAVAYGVTVLTLNPLSPSHWMFVIVGVGSVAVAGLYRISLGTLNAIPPVGGVVILIAAMNFTELPLFVVAVFAGGLYLSYAILLRSGILALYAAGIATTGALAFTTLARMLIIAGWWPVAGFAVATAAHLFVILGIEFVRHKGRWNLDGSVGLDGLQWRKLALLFAVCVAAATLAHFATTVFLASAVPPRVLHTGFIIVLVAAVFFGLAMRSRMRQVRRKLNGLVEAAMALPRDGASATPEGVLELVRVTINAETAELRETPAGMNEISAPTSLGSGNGQYVVASRSLSARQFTAEDARVLEGLSFIGGEAIRTRQSVDSLTVEASTDPLTGLPNYRAFRGALTRINDNRDYSEAIAVLFIDVDDFKAQNDDHGHHAGDLLLKAVAERMLGAVRQGDFVSRIGGDEFVIVLTELTSLDEAKIIADRVIQAIDAPVHIDDAGSVLLPIVSVGLAFSAHRETNVDALVIDADRSMLDIKQARGKSGAKNVSGVRVSAHRSARINDVVARAIDENLLTVAFQPIVDITENSIWGFEALARYTDAELGSIPPAALIARAKNLGRLNKLTEQVVEQAMAAATRFAELAPGITVMAVNIEAGQILDQALGAFLRGVPARFTGASLCLELNERSVSVVSDEMRAQVERLRERGIIIALDDYGSENSSVGALVRLPLDILKIDRSLVNNLRDIKQQEVIKALHGFADTFHHTVIVEGIEDEESVRMLEAIGVRNVQGFYFGRPVSLADTLERLQTHGGVGAVPDVLGTCAGPVGF